MTLTVNEPEQEETNDNNENTVTTTPEDLKKMTPEQKANVKTLELTDTPENKITDLNQIDFSGLTNLETLDLSKLENLERADLSKLPDNVKSVNLNGTNITSLNLTGSKVEKINAKGCENLRDIDAEGSNSLTELDVSESNINLVNVKGCINLTSLNCSSCDLEAGNLNLEGCVNLVSLDLSRNHFGWFDYDESKHSILNQFDCCSQDIKDWESKKTFSFTRFFNSGDVTAAGVKIMASAYVNNVDNITGYDEDGIEIDTKYNSQTGIAEFETAPAVIKYLYYTGFNDLSMDVVIHASSYQDEDSDYLDGSGCGGCNAGSSISSLILVAFMFIKKR